MSADNYFHGEYSEYGVREEPEVKPTAEQVWDDDLDALTVSRREPAIRYVGTVSDIPGKRRRFMRYDEVHESREAAIASVIAKYPRKIKAMKRELKRMEDRLRNAKAALRAVAPVRAGGEETTTPRPSE